MQGLWGGQNLWASEDGTAIVQIVGQPPLGKSGLWEKRYRIKLTAEQKGEVERLVGAHDFLRLKIKERPALPDEAHPIIMVVTQSGETARVRKWGDDKQPDFDPLYTYLLTICHEMEGRHPDHEGPFDWDWRPDGFPSPF